MPFVMDVDGNYLAHPGFRAGAPSGMPAPGDGSGIRHDTSGCTGRGGLAFGAAHAGWD